MTEMDAGGGADMRDGWVKIGRKLLKNPIAQDPHALALWITLICKANYQNTRVFSGNTPVDILRGQLLTGRKQLAGQTGIEESKVQRLLKLFENMGMLEQQTNSKFRLISIINYDSYQQSEQQVNSKNAKNAHKTEQQMNSKSATKTKRNGVTPSNHEQQKNSKRTTNEHYLRIKESKKESSDSDFLSVDKIDRGGGVGKARFDILRLLDEKSIQRAKAAAPGKDIYYLIGMFNEFIKSPKGTVPDKPAAAFVAWCGKINKQGKGK